MFEIIVQYFKMKMDPKQKDYELRKKRQGEYNHCLRENIKHPQVNKIHILLEKEEDRNAIAEVGIDPKNPKLVVSNLGKYLHYADAFDYCNKNLKGKLCVVLHTDIWLTQGWDKFARVNFNNTMYALARTNVDEKGKLTGRGIRIYDVKGKKCCGSIDGWAFKAPVKQEIVNESDHQQNVWGADNRIIWLFKHHGYQVYTPNPKDLKLIHWHHTDLRVNQNNNWITKDMSLIPASKEFDKKRNKVGGVVGGMIPLAEGTAELISI